MVECRTRNPEVPSSNPGGDIRKILRGLLRTVPPFLKLSDVKTRSCNDTVVKSRTRDPEFPRSNSGAGKRTILTGPIRTVPAPIPLSYS